MSGPEVVPVMAASNPMDLKPSMKADHVSPPMDGMNLRSNILLGRARKRRSRVRRSTIRPDVVLGDSFHSGRGRNGGLKRQSAITNSCIDYSSPDEANDEMSYSSTYRGEKLQPAAHHRGNLARKKESRIRSVSPMANSLHSGDSGHMTVMSAPADLRSPMSSGKSNRGRGRSSVCNGVKINVRQKSLIDVIEPEMRPIVSSTYRKRSPSGSDSDTYRGDLHLDGDMMNELVLEPAVSSNCRGVDYENIRKSRYIEESSSSPDEYDSDTWRGSQHHELGLEHTERSMGTEDLTEFITECGDSTVCTELNNSGHDFDYLPKKSNRNQFHHPRDCNEENDFDLAVRLSKQPSVRTMMRLQRDNLRTASLFEPESTPTQTRSRSEEDFELAIRLSQQQMPTETQQMSLLLESAMLGEEQLPKSVTSQPRSRTQEDLELAIRLSTEQSGHTITRLGKEGQNVSMLREEEEPQLSFLPQSLAGPRSRSEEELDIAIRLSALQSSMTEEEKESQRWAMRKEAEEPLVSFLPESSPPQSRSRSQEDMELAMRLSMQQIGDSIEGEHISSLLEDVTPPRASHRRTGTQDDIDLAIRMSKEKSVRTMMIEQEEREMQLLSKAKSVRTLMREDEERQMQLLINLSEANNDGKELDKDLEAVMRMSTREPSVRTILLEEERKQMELVMKLSESE